MLEKDVWETVQPLIATRSADITAGHNFAWVSVERFNEFVATLRQQHAEDVQRLTEQNDGLLRNNIKFDRAAQFANEEVQRLTAENEQMRATAVDVRAQHDRFLEKIQQLTVEHAEDAKYIARLREALRSLRIDANRLCDRQLGGSYEDDCRLAIKAADAVLKERAK
jgi:predicted RNase H-like nuclease (RuvC/YqgF family)